jgi:hypothetical protein
MFTVFWFNKQNEFETDTERLSILVMQKFNLKGREREGRNRVVRGADKM